MTPLIGDPRQRGFTLVELLVVIVILGTISFALTNSVILGLRTTNSTANRVAGTSAVEALNSYFFGDVQSADQVSATTTSATDTNCGPVAGAFLHLTWTTYPDIGTDVFYAYDPATGGQQDLIRVECSGSADPDRTILGVFSHDPAAEPVTVVCGAAAPCAPSGPMAAAVTLSVQSDPAAPRTALTAERRPS